MKNRTKHKLIIIMIVNLCCLLMLAQNDLDYQLDDNQRILVFEREKGNKVTNKIEFFVGDTLKSNQSPIVGKYEIIEDTLVFKPYFPFRYGLTYSARINKKLVFRFKIPYPEHIVAPELEAIYPSDNIIPENQLKFYIHFNQPMSEGYAYQCIRLVSLANGIVEDPFVQLQPELWDEDRQRLTLWLDPGKIKRGLNPNLERGTPLQNGQEYVLLINRGWKSTFNLPLKANYHKSFKVVEADRTKPSVNSWKIKPPQSPIGSALLIQFHEALDHALLLNTIKVYDASGKTINGEIRILEQEHQWAFTPNNPWKKGAYKIQIDAKLEDLAGNNLNRLFDRDLASVNEEEMEKDFFWYKFIVE